LRRFARKDATATLALGSIYIASCVAEAKADRHGKIMFLQENCSRRDITKF
jgi:hypothetical protein